VRRARSRRASDRKDLPLALRPDEDASEIQDVERLGAHHVTRARGQRALMAASDKTRKDGLRRALVTSYEARSSILPEALRAAIEAADDEDTLTRWVALFATGSADEIAEAVLGVSDSVSTTG
jgi:hypothetical protein